MLGVAGNDERLAVVGLVRRPVRPGLARAVTASARAPDSKRGSVGRLTGRRLGSVAYPLSRSWCAWRPLPFSPHFVSCPHLADHVWGILVMFGTESDVPKHYRFSRRHLTWLPDTSTERARPPCWPPSAHPAGRQPRQLSRRTRSLPLGESYSQEHQKNRNARERWTVDLGVLGLRPRVHQPRAKCPVPLWL